MYIIHSCNIKNYQNVTDQCDISLWKTITTRTQQQRGTPTQQQRGTRTQQQHGTPTQQQRGTQTQQQRGT